MTDKVNYALAPAGATNYDFFEGDFYWLKCERAWMYFYDGEWCHCEDNEQPEDAKEIPARERELNRWADSYEYWNNVTKNEILIFGAPAITENDFYHRRAERIEAGLIDEPIIADVSKDPWMPKVGEYCEAAWLVPPDGGSPEWTCGTFKGEFDGLCWFGCFEEVVVPANAIEFRPLKTPEQKAREAFLVNALALKPEELYAWVTSEGVDLTPLIKELNK